MYLGFILIRYGMMTDMETTAFQEKCIIFNSQEEEAQQTTQGHMGKQQGQSGGRSEETAQPRVFTVFSSGMQGQGRYGTQV